MLKNLIAIVALSLTLSSCIKGTDNNFCEYDPCDFEAPDSERQLVQDYLVANSITAIEHCSGMYYVIDNPGTGRTPEICNNVTVTYTGRLTDGTIFDQSTAPVSFPLSNLIAGWKNGIPLIKEGGSIKLIIPPSLAYGTQPRFDQDGNLVIPANSILVMDIGLIQVQ